MSGLLSNTPRIFYWGGCRELWNFFRQIGVFDLENPQKKTMELTDEDWASEAWRQKSYPVHQQTQTISLIFDKDFRHSNPTVHSRFEQFQKAFAPLMQSVADYFSQMPVAQENEQTHREGYFVRLIIVKLRDEGIVHPHGDGEFSLMHSHRIHIPIFIEGEVLFKVGTDCRTLQAGTIREINNKCHHAVKNVSGKPRIDVITDWVIPGERCCDGKRRHPDGECSPEGCKATDYQNRAGDCYQHQI